jgi:imidazoleglycerol-phosphate dehydratase
MGTGRSGTYRRETLETRIEVSLNLDGSGTSDVTTGVGMLDHLLNQLARHGIFDLTLHASGDLYIDPHHTTEDAGIALGRAFADALGEGTGIVRMADALVPLDEALAHVAVDLSGRGYAVTAVNWSSDHVGELPGDLIEHFLHSFAHEGHFNLNVRVLSGVNDHHKAECIFKALARALCNATRLEPRRAGVMPSTKETLA